MFPRFSLRIIDHSRRRDQHIRRLLSSSKKTDKTSSSTSKTSNLPPLPPPTASSAGASKKSPAQAKQEYLKASSATSDANVDPLQKMARLEKELDIVRERAAARMEERLQKTVWQRLTDPIKRQSHSWINVGAVLLAYILAHNLYMSGKEKRMYKEQLEDTTATKELYQQAMRNLLQTQTLEQISNKCVEELQHAEKDASSSFSSWWTKSSSTMMDVDDQDIQKRITSILQEELHNHLGDHVMTDEERRVAAMQKAWEDSQRQVVTDVQSPEQELVHAILDSDEAQNATETKTKTQRRVFSM